MSKSKNIKSPFLIIEEFISPKICELIVDNIMVTQPDIDINGDPVKMERQHDEFQSIVFNTMKEKNIEDRIKETYNAKYKGTSPIIFQYFPENAKVPAKQPGCENSKYLRKKWVKVKDIDLVGYIWLKDYQNSTPLDPRSEIYGGKMEFPAYNFSLVPQRGTLVIFPAGPHFITAISPILVSDLYQIKIDISVSTMEDSMWFYQPQQYPGDWTDWFEGKF